MRKYFCDVCGKEVSIGNIVNVALTINFSSVNKVDLPEEKELNCECCLECAKDFSRSFDDTLYRQTLRNK